MSTPIKVLITLVLIAAVGGGAAYWYVSRPVAAPSAPIETQNQGPAMENEMEGEEGEHDFRISSEESEVSFTLGEMLRGEPTTVVGKTNQVTGTITFDEDEPDVASAGAITINARALATDEAQRNGAIARFILESEKPEFEYITFTPSDILGLPSSVEPGDSFNFRVNGALKIRDITKDVSFTGSAKLVNGIRLEIDVQTTVDRADFNLVIPNIPFVADVDEEVTLKAHLVAVKNADRANMPDEGREGEDEEPMDPINASLEADVDIAVRNITVTGSMFKFEPSRLTVKKGEKVRLTFKNTGGNHDFVIDELGVSTPLVRGEGEAVVEFTPTQAGTFNYYCSVSDHRAKGMEGTIVVTE